MGHGCGGIRYDDAAECFYVLSAAQCPYGELVDEDGILRIGQLTCNIQPARDFQILCLAGWGGQVFKV